MKRIITLLILLFIICRANAADDTINVVVLNFTPLHNITASEANQVTEVIRSEIIKSEFIKSIESDQLEKFEKEIQLQKTGLTEELIIDLGKRLKTEYFIMGSYSSEGDSIIITVRLVSAKTGENIDAWNRFSTKEQITKDLPDLSDNILTSILTTSLGNTLPNIKRLIDRGELFEASAKYNLFKRTHSPDNEMSATEKELILKLADYHYKKADELVSEKSISEAYYHSGKSVKYAPENEDYQELYKKVLTEYTLLKQREYKTVIENAEELTDSGKLDAAQKHLSKYITAEGTRFTDESYYSLLNRIKEERIKSKCETSESTLSSLPYFLSFRTFSYTEFVTYNTSLSDSRDMLLSILDEKPDDKRALKLLDKTNSAMGEIRKGYNSQKGEDAFSEYLSQYRWHLDLGLNYQEFLMTSSPLSPSESYPGIKIEGGIRNLSEKHFTFMIQSSLSYVQGTENRNINNVGYELNHYSTALTIEVLPGFRKDNFFFFIGPLFQVDFIVRTAENNNNSSDTASTGYSVAIGAGLNFRAEWIYDKNILTFI